MKQFNIAILGATGAVGREMLKVLEEYDFPVGELRPLASARSAGASAAARAAQHPEPIAGPQAFCSPH